MAVHSAGDLGEDRVFERLLFEFDKHRDGHQNAVWERFQREVVDPAAEHGSALAKKLLDPKETMAASDAELDGWIVEAEASGGGGGRGAPALTLPTPTEDEVFALMEFYRADPAADQRDYDNQPFALPYPTLPYLSMLRLIRAFVRAAAAGPALAELTVAEGTRLSVVGDTHGQLQDVFHVFDINGTPSLENRYLFNGDFVDRGPRGVEIVTVLMAWALARPGAVLLTRGNHEEHVMNLGYGFTHEVRKKYQARRQPQPAGQAARPEGASGEAAPEWLRVYRAFQTAFQAMPLACLVSGSTSTPTGMLGCRPIASVIRSSATLRTGSEPARIGGQGGQYNLYN